MFKRIVETLSITLEILLGVIYWELILRALADIVLEMWSVKGFVEDFLPLDMPSVLL